MKTRMTLLTLAFCVFAAVTSFAADNPNVGTWKLNEAKSKVPAGAVKNTSVVYTAEGDNYKCVVDGTDADGQPAHNEWTGKFDGKDYPVTGDPNADTRSLKMIDEHHYKVTNKKDGKPTFNGDISIAADGKSRTLTGSSKDAKGKKVTSTSVYDKE